MNLFGVCETCSHGTVCIYRNTWLHRAAVIYQFEGVVPTNKGHCPGGAFPNRTGWKCRERTGVRHCCPPELERYGSQRMINHEGVEQELS